MIEELRLMLLILGVAVFIVGVLMTCVSVFYLGVGGGRIYCLFTCGMGMLMSYVGSNTMVTVGEKMNLPLSMDAFLFLFAFIVGAVVVGILSAMLINRGHEGGC